MPVTSTNSTPTVANASATRNTAPATDAWRRPPSPKAIPTRPITATPEELHLAGVLVDAASGPVDWSRYQDTSASELRTLIEAKLAGRPPVESAATAPAAVRSLLEALQQSVAATTGASSPPPT